MELKRVVITGLGALTPIGNNAPDFWNGLLAGKNGAGLITHFDTTNFKIKFACELKDFDPTQYMTPKEVNKTSACGVFSVVAAREAISDSRLDLERVDKDRVGVIVGVGIGGITSTTNEVAEQENTGGLVRMSPFFLIRTLTNMLAGNLSIAFGFGGPSYSVTAACTSSASAIADAYHLIQLGKADVILTGGTEAGIVPMGIGGFSSMRALSSRNDDYLTASRPFSLGRDGFVMGEGAGMLVLEEYEHAIARGAHIYAEIAGVGLTSDGYHVTSPHPEGLGAMRAMKLAIEDAGITPDEVDHINMHGTSTPIGDLAETKAVLNLFGEQKSQEILFTAPKSMTGHLLGASAAVETIATALALQNSIAPPTINMVEKDPEIPDWNFCPDKPVGREMRYALNNAFGFGGHNTSILLKKPEN